jgi:hypothetical protein
VTFANTFGRRHVLVSQYGAEAGLGHVHLHLLSIRRLRESHATHIHIVVIVSFRFHLLRLQSLILNLNRSLRTDLTFHLLDLVINIEGDLILILRLRSKLDILSIDGMISNRR